MQRGINKDRKVQVQAGNKVVTGYVVRRGAHNLRVKPLQPNTKVEGQRADHTFKVPVSAIVSEDPTYTPEPAAPAAEVA